MWRRSTLAITFAGVLALPLAPVVAAGPNVVAKGSWSMVEMTKDVNHDGVIDGDGGVPKSGALSLTPSKQIVGTGNHIAQPNERLIGGTSRPQASLYHSMRALQLAIHINGLCGTPLIKSSLRWSKSHSLQKPAALE